MFAQGSQGFAHVGTSDHFGPQHKSSCGCRTAQNHTFGHFKVCSKPEKDSKSYFWQFQALHARVKVKLKSTKVKSAWVKVKLKSTKLKSTKIRACICTGPH